MNLPQIPAWLELPLLKRELIENSHKKRTYVLRILVALIFMLVMLLFYSNQVSQYTSVLQVMGQGRELAAILLVCNLVAIYALLPAMACSAISSEREKQTLSLILITRITPGGLIAEKFLSRLVPMIALMLITLPMLSIAYMLGGLRLEAVFAALLGLFTAAVQVNSAAIMCSALFRTALEAFWATYLLFAIMALGPIVLNEMGLLPNVNWFPVFGNDAIAGMFVLFLGMSVGAIEGFASIRDVCFSAIPPLTVAAVMLVISRFAIAHGQQDAPLSFQTFAKLGRRTASNVFRVVTFPVRQLFRLISGTPHFDVRTFPDDARLPRALPTLLPVAWRERQISALSGWRLHATLLCVTMVLEWGWLISAHAYNYEDNCVIVDTALFIISLLMVIGVTCRTFASERERQTLDLLLTTPLTNRELLKEKLSAANRTAFFLLVPIFFTAITHLLFGNLLVYDSHTWASNYYPMREVSMFETAWWHSACRYLFGLFTHALLYMILVKWIAVYFSLSFNSQMKSMLGTILSILGLCVIPLMLFVIPLLLLGTDPAEADLPIWCFTSPALIPALNETHDFFDLFRSKWWPHSEYFTLFVNLAIYGTLTLLVRSFVIWRLPALLNRRDAA
jgi:ABC-type transport system involved in multi-copper enzyme maturation permease subunit